MKRVLIAVAVVGGALAIGACSKHQNQPGNQQTMPSAGSTATNSAPMHPAMPATAPSTGSMPSTGGMPATAPEPMTPPSAETTPAPATGTG